jgi:hypothetical protein
VYLEEIKLFLINFNQSTLLLMASAYSRGVVRETNGITTQHIKIRKYKNTAKY